MKTLIIVICLIGFIITYTRTLLRKNYKAIENKTLGTASEIKLSFNEHSNEHVYSVKINQTIYNLKTKKDFSNIIKEGYNVDILTMKSGRKFLRFDSNKSFIFLISNTSKNN